MELKQIASLGRTLVRFLALFADCFGRQEPRELLAVYVRGQLSELVHKSVEPMAVQAGIAPRTLQHFLESVKWDEEKMRDRCQQIVATQHADSQAIGIVDESGVLKCGNDTAGVARQWCGNAGKVDNCVVNVHLCYATEGLQCLLDSTVYLPEEWALDRVRREKAYIPDEVEFQTKPEIAIGQIDRALGHGIRVAAWTFDELYGRDHKFLDAMEQRHEAYVAEVPVDFHGWVRQPQVLHRPVKKTSRSGRRKKYPRLARGKPACKVQNLAKYSPPLRIQSWKRFRIKDSQKGPVVWEVKWAHFWRKQGDDNLPLKAHCLIVARNVLKPKEVKYFVANRIPGEENITLNWLLWVAFRRWPVEQCFRIVKKELGMDHYEVRGWRCLHRHCYLTQLTHLFCARIREEYNGYSGQEIGRLTVEQVRRAVNTWIATADLPPAVRRKRHQRETEKILYYRRRNEQARKSHTKMRLKRLQALEIDIDQLESCIPSDY